MHIYIYISIDNLIIQLHTISGTIIVSVIQWDNQWHNNSVIQWGNQWHNNSQGHTVGQSMAQ